MVTLQELGKPFATGRGTEIFTWPEDSTFVLKLFPADFPSEEIDHEIAACRETERLGINPLKTGGRVEVEGQSGILLERLDGISLTAQAEKNPLTVVSGARVLGSMHAKLHDIVSDHFPDVRTTAIEALDSEPLGFLSEQQKATAVKLINALPEGDSVLHMDFHTENVFSHGESHVIIDWPTAMRGNPAADVAATVLMLQDAELWPGALFRSNEF